MKLGDFASQLFQVDLLIVGMAGQKATVRTGWFLATDSVSASLSTLFVIGKETDD